MLPVGLGNIRISTNYVHKPPRTLMANAIYPQKWGLLQLIIALSATNTNCKPNIIFNPLLNSFEYYRYKDAIIVNDCVISIQILTIHENKFITKMLGCKKNIKSG